eukprot:TRINITY_DN8696_c0_g1_i1.p1 TRINITY_DN8696_c0_g1~~TRINITY_DN8696_c0_g1_i1.p1  ORF type:complete len:407 (+),score=109.13 TRINITY_DN8696_c0_g1_i1:42-1262(+)
MFSANRLVSRSVRSYSTQSKVYLVGAKRTPFGKFGGSLKDVTPNDLGVHSVKATLEDARVAANLIDHVVLGNVVPSTTDTLYGSRHIGLKSGVRTEVPAYAVNRLCGSGIQAIADAKHLIQRGEAECVLAVGTENMSLAPHLTYGARWGTKYGEYKVVDMLQNSLVDALCNTPMAITAENLAVKFNVTRKDCDEYSLNSHRKGSAAYKNNHLQGEIAPFPLKKKTVDRDEHLRDDINIEEMSKLSPVFKKDGTVTAANASGIVDGAASVLVVSEAFLKKHGLKPLAEVGAYAVVGVEPTEMGIGASHAVKKLLAKLNAKVQDIDLFEINEAFAAQVVACAKDLNLDLEKLNVWGGAVALGHPLGATGVRITNTLARQMNTLNKKHGIASACIGGGQGIAIELKLPQ